jgi:pyridoxamine 5'-phosphate oxidase
MDQNPISRINEDRVQARRLDDPNADTCILALADENGLASVRNLVLRDVVDNRFLVFINQTSPKWRILTAGGSYQLLLWYPSMQRQYRISGTTQVLAREFVANHWLRRPNASKYLDLYYETIADKSTAVESRQALVDTISEIRQQHDVDTMTAPSKVAGIELVADCIECLDLNREDRVHDRLLYKLVDASWTSQVMVP